ncbi:transcription initiation factor TFIIIB [Priestia aryabhattai]|uniref:Transcription initiation factor TFIIIB n=1 Tax=Priestia aryabhattai TaxID=412384 RepID=A0AAX6NDW4_PRIAR|nr:transcription initiation factor TFIIIB [Priestia aryabhattai]MDU9694009.1 transcription initiation factor TFIIIB [Priestia aryabhattai]NGY88688.1 transcription initiation factor TFIIIB [Priestia megaterium]
MGNSRMAGECPKCGSKELGKGRQDSYAVVRPIYKRVSLGSAVEHIICTDCGLIIESYVKNPEKFKGSF